MSRQTSPKQLLIGYLCVTAVVVVLVGLCSLYLVRNLYVQQTAQDLQVRARLCSKPIAELLGRNETDAVDALCKELGKAVDTRITVILLDGRVVGDTEKDPLKMENHGDRPEIRQVIESPGAVGRATRYSTTLEKTLMYVAVASPDDGPPLALVRTSIPVDAVTEKLASANQGIFTAALVAGVLIVAAIPWFSIRLNRLTNDGRPRPIVPDDDQYDDEHDLPHTGEAEPADVAP